MPLNLFFSRSQSGESLPPKAYTFTLNPRDKSSRAHTYPSPPLLPVPQTTSMQSSASATDATSSAMAKPALRISSSEEMPSSFIVYSSAARIISAVNTLYILHLRIVCALKGGNAASFFIYALIVCAYICPL